MLKNQIKSKNNAILKERKEYLLKGTKFKKLKWHKITLVLYLEFQIGS
jgi:hypothetical protein